MSDLKLSDEQWAVIAPLLPPQPKTGRRRRHDRQVLNSLVYRLKTGVRYKDIPKGGDYAAKSTVYHWLRRWSEEGVLDALWRHLLSLLEAQGQLSLVEGSLDGTFVASKRGGERRGRSVKGNGSTLMVVSEAHGLPVAFVLEAANTHESQLARDVLAKVCVPRLGKGRPRTRILTLAMDKAFDARDLRRDLRKRGIRTSIPERNRRGKRRQRGPKPKLYEVSRRRYKVERVNAWMDNFRGLVVRYERKAAHYLSYCTLAAILFCLKRLLP